VLNRERFVEINEKFKAFTCAQIVYGISNSR